MSLPEATQKLVDQANALLNAGNPANAAPAAQEEKPENPDKQPIAAEEAPTQAAQPAEAPNTAPEHDATYWQHRFNVIQGKYNTEIPALRTEINTLKGQIAKSDSAQDAVDRVKDLTPDEIDEFGPELVAFIKKVAGNNSGDSQRLEALEQQVATQSQQRKSSAEDTFWEGLKKAVPDFIEVNSNPEFQRWVSQVDPMVGKPRQTLLEEAQSDLDYGRVAVFFNTFKSSIPTPQTTDRQTLLNEQVQVPNVRNESQVPEQKRIWSAKEIAAFYKDVTIGQYRGRDEEKQRIENDIFLAQTEGRIAR
ncbi:hypothetical protein [uncultured Amphritea sp.]|uniref:hypothetical protein n=1 Tax=uncultured Amphritea sp. TaxID=981605 RepID=UPI00260B76FD|nr:hypothetical protein [uncultured Amphritea sp.]